MKKSGWKPKMACICSYFHILLQFVERDRTVNDPQSCHGLLHPAPAHSVCSYNSLPCLYKPKLGPTGYIQHAVPLVHTLACLA